MFKVKSLAITAALGLAASSAAADGWVLEPGLSNLSFGSVKNEYVGESHRFGEMTGGVAEDGTMTLNVALGSVETAIDIRNERMVEHVFQAAPSATITAALDLGAMDSLAVGAAMTTEVEATVSLLGTDADVFVPVWVMRLSEDRVLATTDGMAMVATDELGIDAGIDVLQELAGLDSITRVTPVTLRMVFDREG